MIEITQQQDIYSWRAYYANDHLDEADATSGFASVDKAICTHMALLQGEDPIHMVEVPAGAEPVFFRRRQITLSLNDDTSEQTGTTHCIGWKKADQEVYLFVLENGCSLLTSNLQAV